MILRSVLLSCILLVQGCTSTPDEHQQAMQTLHIAAPLPVNYKHELLIANLTQTMQKPDLTAEQQASLFFQRGNYYDKVGLKRLAFFDFQQALKLKPNYIQAYNFIGIYATLSQQFTQAFNAFDSVLELQPSYEYAYLNRGVSLYYADRPALAAEDLNKFLSFQPDDPYNAIWLYFSELAAGDIEAKNKLAARKATLSNDEWANALVNLFLGEVSESELLSLANDPTNSSMPLIQKLCEAYFYLAKISMFEGNLPKAEQYFNLALSTNVYEFVEHRYARLELDLLYVEAVKQTTEQEIAQ